MLEFRGKSEFLLYLRNISSWKNMEKVGKTWRNMEKTWENTEKCGHWPKFWGKFRNPRSRRSKELWRYQDHHQDVPKNLGMRLKNLYSWKTWKKTRKNPESDPNFEGKLKNPRSHRTKELWRCQGMSRKLGFPLTENHNSHFLVVPVIPCQKSREFEPCLFSTLQLWPSGAVPTKCRIREEPKKAGKGLIPCFWNEGKRRHSPWSMDLGWCQRAWNHHSTNHWKKNIYPELIQAGRIPNIYFSCWF